MSLKSIYLLLTISKFNIYAEQIVSIDNEKNPSLQSEEELTINIKKIGDELVIIYKQLEANQQKIKTMLKKIKKHHDVQINISKKKLDDLYNLAKQNQKSLSHYINNIEKDHKTLLNTIKNIECKLDEINAEYKKQTGSTELKIYKIKINRLKSDLQRYINQKINLEESLIFYKNKLIEVSHQDEAKIIIEEKKEQQKQQEIEKEYYDNLKIIEDLRIEAESLKKIRIEKNAQLQNMQSFLNLKK